MQQDISIENAQSGKVGQTLKGKDNGTTYSLRAVLEKLSQS